MSKVAAYLQEHIQGEVSTNSAILTALGRDMGVLEITPEMAVYPRVTSDIRKVARFSWQLAEKGHVLPITIRGNGSDQTGGAIGKGISIVTPAHMNTVFELDPKQKLVRLQRLRMPQ
jgi:FAD/FMN-containing dehydrogenase